MGTKTQNFTLIQNPNAKKHPNKKLFSKNVGTFASFLKIILDLCNVSHFRLWFQRFGISIKFGTFWYPFWPILTPNIFFQNTGKNFFSQVGPYGYKKNAEFYAYSKSEDEIEKKLINKKLF